MRLTTEDMDEVLAPSEGVVDEILSSDAFGKFAILSATDDKFIQIASAWTPSKDCQAFMSEHRSDPWILEIRDGAPETHLQAKGFVTLETAREAFKEFLKGGKDWAKKFEWDNALNH